AQEEFNALWNIIVSTRKGFLGNVENMVNAQRNGQKVDVALLKRMHSELEKIGNENIWEEFMLLISEREWYKKLNNTYPTLTTVLRRCCVLTRADYSTQSAAELLNVGPRTVEHYRNTLRHIFGLEPRADLTEFLLRF
ncbi:MAG: hypothetical protein KDD10_29925, partial [Phaeodactylibacter sp.]|nr:hypothetical protein [Phaeodactylibacter sp.]